MFKNFFNKLESTKKEENLDGGSKLVDRSYHYNQESMEKIDYTSLLDEKSIEWKREEVEAAKNKFNLVKDQLPEDFASKPYEERMSIVNSIMNTTK